MGVLVQTFLVHKSAISVGDQLLEVSVLGPCFCPLQKCALQLCRRCTCFWVDHILPYQNIDYVNFLGWGPDIAVALQKVLLRDSRVDRKASEHGTSSERGPEGLLNAVLLTGFPSAFNATVVSLPPWKRVGDCVERFPGTPFALGLPMHDSRRHSLNLEAP